MKTYQQNLNVIKNAANNALSGNAAERQTLNPNTAAMREGGTLCATRTGGIFVLANLDGSAPSAILAVKFFSNHFRCPPMKGFAARKNSFRKIAIAMNAPVYPHSKTLSFVI